MSWRPPELTWSQFGDTLAAPAIDGGSEPYFVLHGCALLVGKGYYCETHRQPLANLFNLTQHLESGGRHHVAVWCPVHRVYESADAAQIEALEHAIARGNA